RLPALFVPVHRGELLRALRHPPARSQGAAGALGGRAVAVLPAREAGRGRRGGPRPAPGPANRRGCHPHSPTGEVTMSGLPRIRGLWGAGLLLLLVGLLAARPARAAEPDTFRQPPASFLKPIDERVLALAFSPDGK